MPHIQTWVWGWYLLLPINQVWFSLRWSLSYLWKLIYCIWFSIRWCSSSTSKSVILSFQIFGIHSCLNLLSWSFSICSLFSLFLTSQVAHSIQKQKKCSLVCWPTSCHTGRPQDGQHRWMNFREAYINIWQPLEGAVLICFLGGLLDCCWDEGSTSTMDNYSIGKWTAC